MVQKNWSGHVTFGATGIAYPTTTVEVQELVQRHAKLKVIGSGHSFNDIADSAEALISLARFDAPPVIDAAQRSVSVNAGITYGELAAFLDAAGYALPNMASLPHITVAGAIATATHGSGDSLGNLATAVTGLEVVTGAGEVVTFSPAHDVDAFAGAVVSLGALGVVTRVTLALQPAFTMQQEVYERLPLAEALDHFDAIMSSAYSVSYFTDWQHDSINSVWLKRRLADGAAQPVAATFHGATAAQQHRRPVDGASGEPCTPQLGDPGPWHQRLPHFRADFVLTGEDELQSEYFVARDYAVDALRALAALGPAMTGLIKTSEIRSMAADGLWMSMAYGQETVGLHVSWHSQWPAVRGVLTQMEAALEPYAPRPHWGKLFTLAPAQVQARYPRLADFRALVRRHDPQGKFRNAFVDRYIFGAA